MDTMHRIAGLESNYIGMTHLFEGIPNLQGCAPQIDKIIIIRQIDYLQCPRNIHLTPAYHFRNQRVFGIGSTQDQASLSQGIPVVYFFDLHHCQGIIAGIA